MHTTNLPKQQYTYQTRGILAFSLFTFLLFTFSMSVHAKTIQETFDANNGGGLKVQTDVGKFTINTHTKATIDVTVEIEGKDKDDFMVEFIPKDGNLQIIGERGSEGWNWNNSLKVHFIITLPEQYNIQLDTAGGSIKVDDLMGNIQLNTSGGSITIGNIQGNVQADTSGGSIKIGDIVGNVAVKTSGGSIRVGEVEGELSAKTSGGSIKATFAQQITQNAELKTSGGSITATLLDTMKVNIKATTSGGRVSSDFAVQGINKKRKIEGTINGGGPQLRLHTSGGSVKIKKSS